MNTLVIHADTYTGGYAARALVTDPGFKVRVAARRKESVEDLVRAGAEFIELAHSPPTQDDLDTMLRGVYDAVLVIAPTQRARDDALTWVNALSKAENLRRVVVLSVYRADRGYDAPEPYATLDAVEAKVSEMFPRPPKGQDPRPGDKDFVVLRVGYVQQNLVYLAEVPDDDTDAMDATLDPEAVVVLHGTVVRGSDPTAVVTACAGCVKRETKRMQRKKTTPATAAPGAPTAPPSPPPSVGGSPRGLAATPSVPPLSDDSSTPSADLMMSERKILLVNAPPDLDVSTGDVALPIRIPCYCRHHKEKVGVHCHV
ncbi:hypothetical protein AMAG_13940 [Allomyces macrogynus ATCC 38327]|uniref:SPT23/MGA2-like DNA-binding domain-containing protein n=1 Tax=Allomyces macrogynus (strain ATCC 38327) TaxID=578462 RepID=A0A0L0T334_ALLM3|nr:hypothetical protein AMAG_13940 [Allomyces macrogynus ATCC 38327]|eukprot:KNE69070.1 hypothetical protein AMAG_13940 [Allomyces macrogynus ATCC 38327]